MLPNPFDKKPKDPFAKANVASTALAVGPLLTPPALAQQTPPSLPPPEMLSKDVATCLQQARAALGSTVMGNRDTEQIDAYAANGRIFFNNPFVTQNPTFAFWKCLRLKGYQFNDG
jgi:hypothetical protein